MPTANQQLLDQAIRHSHFLERYKGRAAGDVVALLQDVAKDLEARLSRTGAGTLTAQRLTRVQEDVRALIGEYMPGIREQIRQEVLRAGAYEAGFAASRVESVVPVTLELARPSEATIQTAVQGRRFAGKSLGEWLDTLDQNLVGEVQRQIQIGYAEGDSIPDITRRVMNTGLPTARRGAEALTRTAVQYSMTEARELTYGQNSNVIKGVQWVSTLDTRTTPICQSRDGTVYAPQSGPRPPAHVGCRSSTAPVLKSWQEMGYNARELTGEQRASMDGQVPASKNYGDWLADQSATVQREVLGEAKAKLFRQGNLDVSRFVGPAGEPLTLDELAREHRAAFERAGLDSYLDQR